MYKGILSSRNPKHRTVRRISEEESIVAVKVPVNAPGNETYLFLRTYYEPKAAILAQMFGEKLGGINSWAITPMSSS